MTPNSLIASRQRYYQAIRDQKIAAYPDSLEYFHNTVLRTLDFIGKRVLDIGAGTGAASAYAACSGAQEVVALEPEVEGSAEGARARFGNLVKTLNLTEKVKLYSARIQDYDSGGRLFDVFLSFNSINHLDEQACIDLHRDQAAWETYRRLLQKISDMAAPGAAFVITDSARRNFYADLGLRSPFNSKIQEWEKHQSPALWAALLREVGFEEARIGWRPTNRVPERWRSLSETLIDNRWAAYFLSSRFYLIARKRGR
jgi:SAM-dependent methyltransferase